MNRQERRRYFREQNPKRYVEASLQKGYSPFGILTGAIGVETVNAIHHKDTAYSEFLLDFFEEIARLLVPKLSEEKYIEFVCSVLWGGEGPISAERLLEQYQEIGERVKSGELRDLETVLALRRQKFQKVMTG